MGSAPSALRVPAPAVENASSQGAGVRSRGAAQPTELASLQATELASLQARVRGLEGAVRAIESQLGAGPRLVRAYASGVALLHASITFTDLTGRVLRYREVDAQGRPVRGPMGWPRLTPDGDGPVVRISLLATGFLASRDGLIVTTRHSVRPWEGDPVFAGLPEEGLQPHVDNLRAFFPGITEALPLTVAGVSAADVVLLRAQGSVEGVPVLPLEAATAVVPGQAIVLLGYPGGLHLLLARIDPARLHGLVPDDLPDVSDDTVDIPALLERLSREGLIRPYATLGHLADVRPHQLALDAETAVGGSGGPILATTGQVIGLISGISRNGGEFKFGAPIGPVVELVRSAARGSRPGP